MGERQSSSSSCARVWPEGCLPYTSLAGQVASCPAVAPCQGQQVQVQVQPSPPAQVKVQPAYRVGRGATAAQPRRREEDIMWEIKTQGPVQAVMEVYTDFFMYASGVYQVTGLLGYHMNVPEDEPGQGGGGWLPCCQDPGLGPGG